MAGFPDISAVQVTPGRKTRVRFDVEYSVRAEANTAIVKLYNEIAQTVLFAQHKNTRLVPNCGWKLKPRQVDIGAAVELLDLAGQVIKSVVDGGTANMPSGHQKAPMHRSPTDLPNATTGASANLNPSGDDFYRRRVTAGDNWDASAYSLTADKTAQPSPYPDDDTLVTDRDLVNTVTESDHEYQWRFFFPGSGHKNSSELTTIYFPAARSVEWTQKKDASGTPCRFGVEGDGYWSIKFYGDGRAQLFEWGYVYTGGDGMGNQQYLENTTTYTNTTTPTKVWAKRGQVFNWCEPSRVFNQGHAITIETHIFKYPIQGRSGNINVWVEGTGVRPSGGVMMLPTRRTKANQQESHFSYAVRFTNLTAEHKPVPRPIRKDTRRDVVAKSQVSKLLYPLTGYVFDDIVFFPFPYSASSTVHVSWIGNVPDGCTITTELYPAGIHPEQATPMVPASVIVNADSGETIYLKSSQPTEYKQNELWQVKITLTSPDGVKSPILYQIRITANGGSQTVADGEFVALYPMKIDITQGESDPSHESASVVLEDLTYQMPLLHKRGTFHMIVDTEYQFPGSTIDWDDPSNEGKQSVLFNGWTERALSTRKGYKVPKFLGANVNDPTQVSPYPAAEWRRYDISAFGEWQRGAAAISPINYDFALDPNVAGFKPYKVTDAIRTILLWSGFVEDQVEIPDLEFRFIPKYGEDGSLKVDVGTPLIELAMKWAKEWLGYQLVFDNNAYNVAETDPTKWRGCWRLIIPKRPPYRNLAYFTTQGPNTGAAGKRLPHMIDAYPTQTSLGGQVVRGAFILKRSLQSWVSKPTANYIRVQGTGDLAEALAEGKLDCILRNFKSYNPYPGLNTADPNHPDYIGYEVPLLHIDPNLSSPEAVKMIARRLYDVMAHAIKGVRFTAPLLLVTDSSDTFQKRPRMLRYYDPVLVDGIQFLVRSCNPSYKKDGLQFATYELEAPREPYYTSTPITSF